MKIFLTLFMFFVFFNSKAQLPLKGDTVIYTKTTLETKQLLPKEIDFIALQTKYDVVLKKYKNAKLTFVNNNKNFTLEFISNRNSEIKITLIGNKANHFIETINLSGDSLLLHSLLPNLGQKTIRDKEVDYWFYLTKTDHKVFIMQGKKKETFNIIIGIKPKSWEHILAK